MVTSPSSRFFPTRIIAQSKGAMETVTYLQLGIDL